MDYRQHISAVQNLCRERQGYPYWALRPFVVHALPHLLAGGLRGTSAYYKEFYLIFTINSSVFFIGMSLLPRRDQGHGTDYCGCLRSAKATQQKCHQWATAAAGRWWHRGIVLFTAWSAWSACSAAAWAAIYIHITLMITFGSFIHIYIIIYAYIYII